MTWLFFIIALYHLLQKHVICSDVLAVISLFLLSAS